MSTADTPTKGKRQVDHAEHLMLTADTQDRLLWRQDLSCTYLAHHELEGALIVMICYNYCRHPNKGQEAGCGLKGPGGPARPVRGAVCEGPAGAAGTAAPPDAGSPHQQHP